MKRFIFGIFFIASALSIFADIDENDIISRGNGVKYIYTPKGQKVLAETIDLEMTASENKELKSYCKKMYPNAVVIGDASVKYNCHAYAWRLNFNNPPDYWLQHIRIKSNTPNLSKFWTNDRYIEIDPSIKQIAEKIVYYKDNSFADASITHSAVSSKTRGYYESKWGQLPVMRHFPDDVPPVYGTNKRYFVLLNTEDGVLVCSNGYGEIEPYKRATYSADASLKTRLLAKRITCTIENAKGDDAVERGTAVVHNYSSDGIDATFTKSGIYEMYLKFYDKDNFLLGNFWFEAIVVD